MSSNPNTTPIAASAGDALVLFRRDETGVLVCDGCEARAAQLLRLNATEIRGKSWEALLGREIPPSPEQFEFHVANATCRVTQIGEVVALRVSSLGSESLMAANARLSEILDSLKEGVWSASPDWSVTFYASRPMAEIYGVPLEEVYTAQTLWRKLALPEDIQNNEGALEELMERDIVKGEFRIRHSTKGIRRLRYTTRLIRDAEGTPLRFDGILSDITETRDLETQLRQAQKLEAVGRLASGIAHDFNNILAATVMNADLGLNNLGRPEACQRYFQGIKESSLRGADLVRRLISFGKGGQEELYPIQLGTTVKGATEMVRRIVGDDVKVELHLNDQDSVVTGNETQVDQVVLNLVVNARDALTGPGIIRIEVSPRSFEEESHFFGQNLGAGDYLRLRVSDNGTGIPAEHLDRVFEPFFTTKEVGKGSGLGLSMVYGIAQSQGGAVAIESEPGKGTHVDVYYPKSDEPARETRRLLNDREATQLLEGHTVLLVEDDGVLREITAEFFSSAGAKVLEADSAESALAMETKGLSISALLCDVMLPGMNGAHLATELAQAHPDMEIFFMTGNAGSGAGEILEGVARERIFAKPCNPVDLVNSIATVVKS